jgi:hypothetical protein
VKSCLYKKNDNSENPKVAIFLLTLNEIEHPQYVDISLNDEPLARCSGTKENDA